jgi:histo-blood group ABO system transferase
VTDVGVTNVDLIVMATGRYKKFLNQFLDSARLHVKGLRGIYVLSDEKPTSTDVNVHWLPWEHMQWPLPTLLRYQAIARYEMEIPTDGVLAYVDVDMRFVGPVDFREITGTFAVEHPGYQNAEPENLPYETRPESAFWIKAARGAKYFCGGVQGGASLGFLEAVKELAGIIQFDLDKGIIPIWHDESAWNWWCATHPPQLVLSSDYCTPDLNAGPSALIIAISKDHDYYRGGNRFSLRRFLVFGRTAASRLKSLMLASP